MKQTPRETRTAKSHLPAVAALWAVALVAYANSFGAGFPMDNAAIILQDTRIRAATDRNLGLIWSEEYWYARPPVGLYRPLTTFTYLFNYSTLGNGTQPAGYHAVNLALHAVNMSLAYLLALLLFKDRGMAFAMAALWGVHPVLTESVTNIVGRADLLGGFGVLAGLLCHVRATRAEGWRRAAWLGGVASAAAVGVFSKESSVVLLAAMAIHDLAFETAPWSRRLAGYAAAAVPCLALVSRLAQVRARIGYMPIEFADNPLVGMDFWTARLTAVRVIGKQIWLLVWPANLSCDYSYNAVPAFAWFDWKALAALVAVAGAVAAAAWCLKWRKRVFFLLAFGLAALAPTSNLVLRIGSIMAERFLYLPALAFAGGVVLAVFTVARQRRRAAAVVLAVIAVGWTARTWARNPDWRDEITLWSAAAKAEPSSYKAHWAWSVHVRETQPETAAAEAERSLAILEGLPDERNALPAYENAGLVFGVMGDRLAARPAAAAWYEKSLRALERAARIDAEKARVMRVETGAKGTLGYAPVYLELGRAYLRLRRPREAGQAFRYGRALRALPEFSEGLAEAWRAQGDERQAAIALMEGLLMDPAQRRLAARLAELYRQTQPASCAVNSTGIDMDCPLVREHLCAAARGRKLAAELGCPADAR
jgi:tetratricopeptide (TPR) repeat protein